MAREFLVPTSPSTQLTRQWRPSTDIDGERSVPAIVDDYLAQMPLARTGTDAEVAELIRFLAGPESAWITGQCIGVDGGHHLRRGPDIGPVVNALFGADATAGRVRP